MTDRTVSLLPVRPTILTRALWSLSDLMAAGRVTIEPLRNFHVIGDPVTFVVVNVTGYVDERDDLLAAIPDSMPADWAGDHGQYREWRGELLTMAIALHETLPPPAATVDIVPAPSPVPACIGAERGYEGACGEPGPHGHHLLGDTPVMDDEPAAVPVGDFEAPLRGSDDQPTAAEWLIENGEPLPGGGIVLRDPGDPIVPLMVPPFYPEPDEPFSTLSEHDEPDEQPEPVAGQVVDVVVLRPAGPADAGRAESFGLEQADSDHWADPATARAWRRYALARAREAFSQGPRFADSRAAFAEIEKWPGRAMLSDASAWVIAAEISEPPRPAASRWWTVRTNRGRHAPGAVREHAAAAGVIA